MEGWRKTKKGGFYLDLPLFGLIWFDLVEVGGFVNKTYVLLKPRFY